MLGLERRSQAAARERAQSEGGAGGRTKLWWSKEREMQQNHLQRSRFCHLIAQWGGTFGEPQFHFHAFIQDNTGGTWAAFLGRSGREIHF